MAANSLTRSEHYLNSIWRPCLWILIVVEDQTGHERSSSFISQGLLFRFFFLNGIFKFLVVLFSNAKVCCAVFFIRTKHLSSCC